MVIKYIQYIDKQKRLTHITRLIIPTMPPSTTISPSLEPILLFYKNIIYFRFKMGATNSFSLYIDVFIDLSNNSWNRNLLSFYVEVIVKSPIFQTK